VHQGPGWLVYDHVERWGWSLIAANMLAFGFATTRLDDETYPTLGKSSFNWATKKI